jgi:hypothetical protein
MISKISNLKLVLGLVLLGLVYLATAYFDSSKSQELDKQLVNIDTARISNITIITPDETVDLQKENNQWNIKLNTGKSIPAVDSKVHSLITQLINIHPDRLAAKDKSKWVDYQVDSTGIRLKVQQDDVLALDMIIGQSASTSYLRLSDEVEVYASDGFGGLNNHDNINHFRDNTFVKMQTDSIQSISFMYPGDSSFQIINESGRWHFDDGSIADSVKIAAYLQKLDLKYNDNFSNQDGSTTGQALAEVTINSKNQEVLFLKAYVDPADSVIFHSSSNPWAFFKDKALGEDYFVGKDSFSQGQE